MVFILTSGKKVFKQTRFLVIGVNSANKDQKKNNRKAKGGGGKKRNH